MSARDRLADVIWDEGSCMWRQPGPNEVADAILNAGYREPARVVATKAELDKLPTGTVIIDADCTPEVFQKEFRVGLGNCGVYWSVFGSGERWISSTILLPATVLYEPEEWA